MAILFTLDDIKTNPDNVVRSQSRYKARVVEDSMAGEMVEVYPVDQPGFSVFRGNIEQFNALYEDAGVI